MSRGASRKLGAAEHEQIFGRKRKLKHMTEVPHQVMTRSLQAYAAATAPPWRAGKASLDALADKESILEMVH